MYKRLLFKGIIPVFLCMLTACEIGFSSDSCFADGAKCTHSTNCADTSDENCADTAAANCNSEKSVLLRISLCKSACFEENHSESAFFEDLFDDFSGEHCRSVSRTAVPSEPYQASSCNETELAEFEWQFTLKNNSSQENLFFSSADLQKIDDGFVIPIEPGKWSIKAKNKFYEGSSDFVEVSDSGYYDLVIKVVHITSENYEFGDENIQSGNGTFHNGSTVYGDILLKINTGNSGITSMVIFQDTSQNTPQSFFKYAAANTSNNGEKNFILIDKKNVQAGSFQVFLSFFIETLCVLSLPEIINVRKDCVTDNWVESLHDTENPQISYTEDGAICLSKSKLNELRGTVFYVKNRNNDNFDGNDFTFENISASENAPASDGSFYSPFDSVQDAVKLVELLNDGTSEYTIYIDGAIIDESKESYSSENNYSFVNISSETPLKLKLEGLDSNATVNANRTSEHTGRIMSVSGNVQLEIKNLKLTGGYTDENGGGIYISAPINESPTDEATIIQTAQSSQTNLHEKPYNLILSGTTKLFGNFSNDSGGGLYIEEGSVLIKDESEVSDNTAAVKGGGLCILGWADKEKRTLDIQGGKLKNNTALSKNKSTGVGGGLYTQFSTIHIESSLISGNLAVNGGGIGIAQNTNIFIENTVITENQAVHNKGEGKGGGGIFASGVSSNLYFKEGCTITGNHTNSKSSGGGGISITSTNVHLCSSVFIKDNFLTISQTESSLQSNVSLASGKKITIDEKLKNTAVGISTDSTPTENNPVIFTNNFKKFNADSNPNLFFTSDNNSFSIFFSGKEAVLALSL